jgi:hypothetical protein
MPQDKLASRVAKVMRDNYPDLHPDWAFAYDWEEVEIPLKSIVASRRPGGRNMDKVNHFAELYASGKEMDPVVVVQEGDLRRMVDGYHRFLGAQKAGKKRINVILGTPAWHSIYKPGGSAFEQERGVSKKAGPEVIVAPEDGPRGGLMLIGPYSDHTWRGKLIDALAEAEIDITVYNPQRDDPPLDPESPEYIEQVAWEREHLANAAVVACWLPGSNPDAYGTRMELGIAFALDKEIVLGIEPGFPQADYIEDYGQEYVNTDWPTFVSKVVRVCRKYTKKVRKADDAAVGAPGADKFTPSTAPGQQVQVKLSPSPDLAYLCGVFNGDAWVEEVGTSRRLVVSAREHDKAFPAEVAQVMQRIGLNPRYWFNRSKQLYMTHAVSVQFYNWITTLSDEGRSKLAHQFPLDYLRGAFESDGTTIDKEDGALSVRFTKKDTGKMNLIVELLKGQGWVVSTWESNGAWYAALTEQAQIADFLAKVKPLIKLPDGYSGAQHVGDGKPGAG